MHRFPLIARAALVMTVLLALIPLARMVPDWLAVSRMIGSPTLDTPARGYDWVSWQEEEGLIVADYVFRRGRQEVVDIQEGDVFFQLDYQQYFALEDLQRAIEGIPPGSERIYTVLRGPQMEEVYVRVPNTRYPTFLYPLSPSLWQFSIWGFVFGAFFHVLGLVIVVPLVRHGSRARFSLLLIVASSLWIFSNQLRLLMVEILGPPQPGTTTDSVFQALTLLGLVGWIGFPALLLHKVVRDAERASGAEIGPLRHIVYLPVAILGLAALATTLFGNIGPLSLDGLVAPILFYACCYIGAAAAFGLTLHLYRDDHEETTVEGWPRIGSIVMLAVALLFGLSVLGVVPIFGAANDILAGWLIVSAQLLSIVPVVLVSLETLRHGKIDQVLSRALTYLTVLGLIFFAFVGGMTLIEPFLDRLELSRTLVAGLYVVVLLVVFERLARLLRVYAAQFFATDRQRTRQQLSRLQERMRGFLDFDTLARETITTVGEAFDVRSGRLFFHTNSEGGAWVSSAYHPEAPYFTERVMTLVWPYFKQKGTIWTRNPELNETQLPGDMVRLMQERGVAVAVPILGEGAPIGLLVLGTKRQRRTVFNLEDLDMLRSLSGQLALAVERLNLIERERALVRESAEAQLSALRAQINPHFLFNALNTVVSLIEEQPDQAVEVVEHLAAIFRHILRVGGRPFISMQDEFELVEHYLCIEQARFGPRLEIERDLDPALRNHPVPAFAVQTLVENAVKHGLEKRRDGGTLRLICRQVDASLVEVQVADTGIGIPALFGQPETPLGDATFFGIGLRNIAARLEKLYGRADLLLMSSSPHEGTQVRLLLPYTPQDSHADRPHRTVSSAATS